MRSRQVSRKASSRSVPSLEVVDKRTNLYEIQHVATSIGETFLTTRLSGSSPDVGPVCRRFFGEASADFLDDPFDNTFMVVNDDGDGDCLARS